MKKLILLTLSLIVFTDFALAQHDTLRRSEVGFVFSNLNSFGLCYKVGNQNTLFRISALSLTGASNTNSYNSYSYNAASYSIPDAPTSSFGAGLNIGLEERKHINSRFYFYYGFAWINSYSKSGTTTASPTVASYDYYNTSNTFVIQSTILNNSTITNTWSLSTGLGVLIGIAYKLSNSFSFGAELVPSVSYTYGETTTVTNSYIVTWTGNNNTGYTPNQYLNTTNLDKINKGFSFSVINTGAAVTIAYRIK